MGDSYYVKELLAQQRIHSVSAILTAVFLLAVVLLMLVNKQMQNRPIKGGILLILILGMVFGRGQAVSAALPDEETEEVCLAQAAFSVEEGVKGSDDAHFSSPVVILVRWRGEEEGILKIEYNREQFAEVLELDPGYGSPVAEQMQMLDVPWILLEEEKLSTEDAEEKELRFLLEEAGSYSFRAFDQVLSFVIEGEETEAEKKEEEKEEGTEESEKEEQQHTQGQPAEDEKKKEEADPEDTNDTDRKEEPVKEETDQKAPEVSMDLYLFTDAYGRQMTTVNTVEIYVAEEHFDFSSLPEVRTEMKDSWTFSGWKKTKNGAEGTVILKKDGEYTVHFQGQDLAGNRSERISSGAFFLDRTNPVITIDGLEDQGAYAGQLIPRIYIEDRSFDLSQVSCTLTGARSGELKAEQFADLVRTEKGVAIAMNRFSDLSDDVYTLSVQATDQAGNAASEELVFAIDQNGSSYMISDETKKLMEAYYTSDPIDLVLSEINTSPIVYEVALSKDGVPVLLEEGKDYTVEVRGGDGDWLIYVYRIYADNFKEEGVYHVDITSRDQAENVNNTQLRGARIDFAVDHTPPVLVVENLTDGSWYKEKEHAFLVRTTDKAQLAGLKILVNGICVLEQKDLSDPVTYTLKETEEEQVVQIIAMDKAGNQVMSERYTVMVQHDEKRVPKEVKERAEKKENRKGDADAQKENTDESSAADADAATGKTGKSKLPLILFAFLPIGVTAAFFAYPDLRRKFGMKK